MIVMRMVVVFRASLLSASISENFFSAAWYTVCVHFDLYSLNGAVFVTMLMMNRCRRCGGCCSYYCCFCLCLCCSCRLCRLCCCMRETTGVLVVGFVEIILLAYSLCSSGSNGGGYCRCYCYCSFEYDCIELNGRIVCRSLICSINDAFMQSNPFNFHFVFVLACDAFIFFFLFLSLGTFVLCVSPSNFDRQQMESRNRQSIQAQLTKE